MIDALLDRQRAGVERDLGIERRLIGIVNAREAHGLAVGDGRAGLGVHPLDVALLADVDRSAAIDFDEVSLRHLAGLVADRAIRADDRAKRGPAVLGDQAGDITDAPDVGVAVFLAEAEALGQVSADLVAVQERAIAAELGEPLDGRVRDGALARTRKAGEPEGHPLAELGRVGLVQDLGDRRPAEPLGELQALGEVLVADLGAGDVGRLDAGVGPRRPANSGFRRAGRPSA